VLRAQQIVISELNTLTPVYPTVIYGIRSGDKMASVADKFGYN
jgi:hypothetical protein